MMLGVEIFWFLRNATQKHFKINIAVTGFERKCVVYAKSESYTAEDGRRGKLSYETPPATGRHGVGGPMSQTKPI